MKKLLFCLSLIVAMVFAVATFSSCESETKYYIELSVQSDIEYEDNVFHDTLDEIIASNKRIDTRLEQIFGKKFRLKADEQNDPLKSEIEHCNKRITSDDIIQKELKRLAELKTVTEGKAVKKVYFIYRCGDAPVAYLTID